MCYCCLLFVGIAVVLFVAVAGCCYCCVLCVAVAVWCLSLLLLVVCCHCCLLFVVTAVFLCDVVAV